VLPDDRLYRGSEAGAEKQPRILPSREPQRQDDRRLMVVDDARLSPSGAGFAFICFSSVQIQQIAESVTYVFSIAARIVP
jgi:hypothetical protein